MVSTDALLVRYQPLAKKVNIIDGVAKPVIEGKNVVIVLANTETDFRTPHINENVSARRISRAPMPVR